MSNHSNSQPHHCHSSKPWQRKPLVIVCLVLSCLILASFIFPFLKAFRITFFEYVLMMGLPIGLGFLIGGCIEYYIPQEYVSKTLNQNNKRSILSAIGLGFLMSACSHGILAIAIQLYKKGASVSSVIAFLLASPWANLVITILLIGFFGWKAFVIIFLSLMIAFVSGLVFQELEKRSFLPKNKYAKEHQNQFSIREDFIRRFKAYPFSSSQVLLDVKGILKGVVSLADMVLWWILIGMMVASLAVVFVSPDTFSQFLGPNITGLFVTLFSATIIEICSEGSSPLAFEIYRQTQAFGNAFVFLMAGVVTDFTEIGLIWKNIGRRTALTLLLVTVPQVIFLGLILNMVF